MEGGNKSAGSKPQRTQPKKNEVTALKMECPVCLDTLLPPIFLCEKGHSLCKKCKDKLLVQLCPICRAGMTDSRNFALENLMSTTQVSCPNNKCVYKLKAEELEDHLKECIFRDFDCIIGEAFGKCFWSGKLVDMLAHYKENHQENCNIEPNSILTHEDFLTHRDNKEIHLFSHNKNLFIFTMKVDTRQGIANWLIQFIGTAKNAKKWIYDVEIFDTQTPERKNKYTEVCRNDGPSCDEIFATGKCASMTLKNLDTYVSDGLLTYSFAVRPLPYDNTNKNAGAKPNFKGKGDGNDNAGPSKNPGPHNKGGPHKPGQQKSGQQNSGQHKPGPHKPRPQNKSGQNNDAGPRDNSEQKNKQAGHRNRANQKNKNNNKDVEGEFIML